MAVSTDEKAMRNRERTDARTRQESKRIPGRIILYARRPKLHMHMREHVCLCRQNADPILTYPPSTGPKHRARLTMLCATPFAYPTACGGVTVKKKKPSAELQYRATSTNAL
jgi:hypothetical protein